MPLVSVVIPAYREAERIGETVTAVRAALARGGWEGEVLVVDDGSPDDTAAAAERAGARVLRQPRNRGKGTALTAGLAAARGDLLLLLDADLGRSAAAALPLLQPVAAGGADMSIAVLQPSAGEAVPRGGGFGLVMGLAHWGVRRAGGTLRAPLSGQRALTRAAWERIGRLDPGFAVEMGLNLDALRLGLRVVEVPLPLSHRVTGRDWAGFRHRGRQFLAVLGALLRRWGR